MLVRYKLGLDMHYLGTIKGVSGNLRTLTEALTMFGLHQETQHTTILHLSPLVINWELKRGDLVEFDIFYTEKNPESPISEVNIQRAKKHVDDLTALLQQEGYIISREHDLNFSIASLIYSQ